MEIILEYKVCLDDTKHFLECAIDGGVCFSRWQSCAFHRDNVSLSSELYTSREALVQEIYTHPVRLIYIYACECVECF